MTVETAARRAGPVPAKFDVIGFRRNFKDAPAYNVFTYSLVNCFPQPAERYVERAVKLFHSTENQRIARNIFELCGDHPASKYDHHQGVKGLLYHTFHCMEKHLAATMLEPPHPSLDRTLLAIAAHDIGKPDVFDGKTREPHQIVSARILKAMGVRDAEVLDWVATHHAATDMRRRQNLVTRADKGSVVEWREVITGHAINAVAQVILKKRSRFLERYLFLRQTYNLVHPWKFLYALRYVLQRDSVYTSLATFFNILTSDDPSMGHDSFTVLRVIRESLASITHPKLPPWQAIVAAYVNGKGRWVLPLQHEVAAPFVLYGDTVPVKSLRIEWTKLVGGKTSGVLQAGEKPTAEGITAPPSVLETPGEECRTVRQQETRVDSETGKQQEKPADNAQVKRPRRPERVSARSESGERSR